MRNLHPEASVEARARQALYDAAPDLLEACELALQLIDNMGGSHLPTRGNLFAAIARAKQN